MTDNAGSTRTPHHSLRRRSTDGVLFRTPTSPHPVGAGFHARPALVDRRRYCAAPTLHQPLSHAASRRDSSPFRGAERWEEVCGVYALASHDAVTFVPLTPVRGGVLDAPRSRDCRGGLNATVRLDRFCPHFPRCARFCSLLNGCNFAGTARAPFRTGAPTLSFIPGRAGVEARPYGVSGKVSACKRRRPVSGGRGVEDAAPYGVCVWVGVSIKPPLDAIRGRVSRIRSA